MLPRTTLPAIAAGLAALALIPGSASADPAGTTLLQSRPSGLAAWPGGQVHDATSTSGAVSADGCKVVFASGSDGLMTGDDDAAVNVFVRDLCADTIELVSRKSGDSGAVATRDSQAAWISANGRYVSFYSGSELATGGGFDGLYRRDLETDETVLVNKVDGVTASVNWNTAAPVTDDGRVAIVTGTKLLPGQDANGGPDLYLSNGTTATLMSRVDGADGAALGNIQGAAISSDGSAAAFLTTSVLDATNDSAGSQDAYVRTGTTTRLASRRDGANGTATGGVTEVALDADGSVTAFVTTTAVDAVNDTNTGADVYRRAGDATALVSRKDGAGAAAGVRTTMPSVDADGDRIAFVSEATGLVGPGESAEDRDVFVRDLAEGRTLQISRVGLAGALADGTSRTPSISADGTHVVATVVDAANLMSTDDDDFTRVMRRELSDGTNELASRPAGADGFTGGGVNDTVMWGANDAISADGRFVVFISRSDRLATGDDDRSRGNAFVRDNRTDTTTHLADQVHDVAISDDARYVAIATTKRLLPAVDGNLDVDAYRLDRETGALDLVSRKADGTSTGAIQELAISGDGSAVAFTTSAKLDAADTNLVEDVYVQRVGASAPELASRRDGPGTVGGGRADQIAVDATGRHVTFSTDAALEALDTGTSYDVYRRDLEQDETDLVSRGSGADTAGPNGFGRGGSLSADGTKVAFATNAKLDASADVNSAMSVYVRDMTTHVTTLASVGADGTSNIADATEPSLSADGTRVAFTTVAWNLGVDPGGRQVWMRDLAANQNILVSRRTGGATVHGTQLTAYPSLSANGRCVAFQTRANLTPDALVAGDFSQVFLRAVDGECPDETAPDTAITDAPASRVKDTTVTFGFEDPAGENGVEFECRLDAGEWERCEAPHEVAGLGEGEHTFHVRAMDGLENRDATPAESTFVVDLSAPQTTLAGPTGRTSDQTPTFEFGADEDARYLCAIDGGDWEDCDPPSKELDTLADGPHSFAVKAIDAVGHEDASPAVAELVVDTDGPSATIGAITAADDGTARVMLSAEAGATFECSVDDTAFVSCSSPLTVSGLAAGAHRVAVRAIDDVGNVGAVATTAFTVPSKPQPQPAPSSPTAAQSPTGTASSGAAPRASATPAPEAARAKGRVKLVARSVRAQRGRATLTLRCATGDCRGTAILKAKIRGKVVVLGRGSYVIAAGRTAKLTLELPAKARKALKPGKRLKATLELGGGAKAALTVRG